MVQARYWAWALGADNIDLVILYVIDFINEYNFQKKFILFSWAVSAKLVWAYLGHGHCGPVI